MKKIRAKIFWKPRQAVGKISAKILKASLKKYPRDGVAAFVTVKTGKGERILLCKRGKLDQWAGTWVTGPMEHMQPKETFYNALVRAMREEIRLDVVKLKPSAWKPLGRVFDKKIGLRGTLFKVEISENDLKKIKTTDEIPEFKLISENDFKKAVKEKKIILQKHLYPLMKKILKV